MTAPIRARYGRLRDTLLFAAAALLVWVLAPYLTGQQEAWDAEPYYTMALLVSGFVAGLFATRPSVWMFIGAAIGQLVYPLLVLPASPFAILGTAFAVAYSALPTASGVIAAVLRGALLKRRRVPPL